MRFMASTRLICFWTISRRHSMWHRTIWLLTGQSLPLDTSPGFDVPEPASIVLLLLAIFELAAIRYAQRFRMV